MPEAARLTDPVSHTLALPGLLVGLVAGAALAVATVATGGLAGVVAAAAIAGGAAGGGLAGQYIGASIMGPPTGALTIGSPNVIINNLPAGLVMVSMANCALEFGAPIPVAQGSESVFINTLPSARKGDKLACSAVILKGSPNVIIGGSPPTTYMAIRPEVPTWLTSALGVVAVGSFVVLGGAVLASGSAIAIAGFGGAAMWGMVGPKVAREIGESLGLSETTIRIMETGSGALSGRLGHKFHSKYKITSEGLGSNFGNIRIRNRQYVGKYKGKPYTLKNVDIRKLRYTKRTDVEREALRSEFNNGIREDFLKNLVSNDAKIARLKKKGITDEGIENMKQGKVPVRYKYEVHHKTPLDDGGDNDFKNLVLISNKEHSVITTAQKLQTLGMKAGDTRMVDLPVPVGTIYIP